MTLIIPGIKWHSWWHSQFKMSGNFPKLLPLEVCDTHRLWPWEWQVCVRGKQGAQIKCPTHNRHKNSLRRIASSRRKSSLKKLGKLQTPCFAACVIRVCTYQQSNPASEAGTWLTMTFGAEFRNVLLPSRQSSMNLLWCVWTCSRSPHQHKGHAPFLMSFFNVSKHIKIYMSFFPPQALQRNVVYI